MEEESPPFELELLPELRALPNHRRHQEELPHEPPASMELRRPDLQHRELHALSPLLPQLEESRQEQQLASLELPMLCRWELSFLPSFRRGHEEKLEAKLPQLQLPPVKMEHLRAGPPT